MEPHSLGKCRAVAKAPNDSNKIDDDTITRQSGNGQIPRAYNDPALPPMEFLLAVMHDPACPMAARIDAAKAVSVYMHPRLAQVTQENISGTRIIIEGGLPALPGTNIIMPSSTGQAGNGTGEPDDTSPGKFNGGGS